MAPAYGEADFFALQAAGLDVLVDPIDSQARFTDDVPDVAGEYVKDADAKLIRLLRERGLLLRHESIPSLISVLLADGHAAHLQGYPNVVRACRVRYETAWSN